MKKSKIYEKGLVSKILKDLNKYPDLIQIMIGPRQVGKTTMAEQIVEQFPGSSYIVAGDAPLPHGPEWIHAQWEKVTLLGKEKGSILLVLDEIQKVRGWSETIKLLWDKSRREKKNIRLLLLGSSSLLLQKGLSESLSGRFILHVVDHWSFHEMHDAFGYKIDDWLFRGGYPGAVRFDDDFTEWSHYINDSLIETVLNRDILQLSTVTKPALLRHLFMLCATHPSHIFSYNKMLGQLQEAGNTTTLSHYLKLLGSAFLVEGLECYRGNRKSKRASSPKIIVRNNALISSVRGLSLEESKQDKEWWGHLLENAIGAFFLNRVDGIRNKLYYWREDDKEVDFILETPKDLWAIEVKSGRLRTASGLSAFMKKYPDARPLVVGGDGILLEDFLMKAGEDL